MNEKDKQLKKNTQQLLENENQKKLLEEAKKNAENESINKKYSIYEKYKKENENIIFSQILKEMSETDISFDNLTKDLVSLIAKNEKFSINIRTFMEDKISSLKEENIILNISHFNILIMGNTGVGKSTLLNKVLKDKLAKTCLGKPCTQGEPKPYESEKAKGIRIWDSKGIENGKYNIEIANKEIKKTIKSLISQNDPDKFIHCIWYCIYSNRFTDEEIVNLTNCYDSYIEKLPIIVVFTQSENQKKTNAMMDYVKKEFEKKRNNGFNQIEEANNNIKFLKVLAKESENDFGVVKFFGIYNLVNETCESSKIGIESSCIHSLMEQGQKILKEELK